MNELERIPALLDMHRLDCEPEEAKIPLSQYLWILKRHRWRISGFVAFCVIATIIISARLTPMYEATATVDIDRQTPPGVVGQDSTRGAQNDSDQFLATQIKLVQSDSVLRPVDRRFHLREHENQTLAGRAEDAPVSLSRLKVTRPPNTYLLLISYRSPDPQLAADASNAIAQSYLEHSYNIRLRSSASLSEFMEKQLDELKAKMERSSLDLAAFERDLNVINPEEKTNILSSRLLQLNSEFTSAQGDRLRKEAAFESVRHGTMEAALATPQGESLRHLSEHINEAREQFSEIKTHFGANHPEYRRAQAKVNEIQTAIDATLKQIRGRVEVEYTESERRESMVKQALADAKAEFDRMNARSFEYQALKRVSEADKHLYEELIRKIKEAEINAGFQNSAIRIADLARPALKPVFVRREFLGEVRCIVFDVAPNNRTQAGKFVGRIWAEDRDFSIVRFNGIYVQGPPVKGLAKSSVPERYFHFDSWRVNVAGEDWVPSQIYVEEEPEPDATRTSASSSAMPRFKAQSRIWDYAGATAAKLEELTGILIESEALVRDQSPSKDNSPLESQRSWERQAEENLVDRLEKGGLLAPPGQVDDVLNTVVNNLIVSANLKVDARVRVLLTTPIETFSVGHTIIISRGLIDVLPDEASLALVLADELSHIALGHATQTQFAFHNQTMLSDADLLQRFRFQRSTEEIAAAGIKTVEIIHASPYTATANAGLFLKALAARGAALPRLLQANLGNQVANADALARLAEFAASAPVLDNGKLEQIAALPLGSRVKLSPWKNEIVLVKTRPVPLLSAREKMPFEVTPFVLYLTRASVEPRP